MPKCAGLLQLLEPACHVTGPMCIVCQQLQLYNKSASSHDVKSLPEQISK